MAPSQSLKHVTWVPFLINSGTEALKYAQTTESTAVAFGWKNVDHATNRHFIEAWTSESDNYSRGEDRGTRMALPNVRNKKVMRSCIDEIIIAID